MTVDDRATISLRSLSPFGERVRVRGTARSRDVNPSPHPTLISDSGGKVRAAINVIHGGDRIARLLMGVARKGAGIRTEKLMLINGELGIVTYLDGSPVALLCFETDVTHIRSAYRILNPEKLKNIPPLSGIGCLRRDSAPYSH